MTVFELLLIMDGSILNVRNIFCLIVIEFIVSSLQEERLESEVICPTYMKRCHRAPKFNTSNIGCSCFLTPMFSKVCVDEFTNTTETNALADIISSNSREDVIRNIILFTLAYGTCTLPPLLGNAESFTFTIVDQCPASANGVLQRKCENPDYPMPIVEYKGYDIDITFKNIHCAYCHGASMEYRQRLIPWEFQYNCKENTSPVNVLYSQNPNTNCPLEFFLMSIPYDCKAIPYLESILARDCTKCLSLNITMLDVFDYDACILCKVIANFKACKYFDTTEIGEDLTRLFRLPSLQRDELITINRDIFKSSELCADNENFDNFFAVCRPFTCSPEKIPYKGACVLPTNTYLKSDNQPFSLNSGILLVKVTFCELDYDTEVNFRVIYNDLLLSLRNMGYNISEETNGLNEGQFLIDSENITLTQFLSLTSSKYYDLVSVEISFAVSNRPSTTDEIEEFCYPSHITCYNQTKFDFLKEEMYVGSVTDFNQTLMYPVDSVLYSLRTSNRPSGNWECGKSNPESADNPNTHSEIGKQDSKRTSKRRQISDFDFMKFPEVCVCTDHSNSYQLQQSNTINCSDKIYQFQESEYSLTDNGELQIYGLSDLHTFSEFYIGRNSVAYVCFNFSGLAQDLFGFDHVQRYLSWVCTGLSCFCLFLSIFVHFLLTENNSTPRKLQLGLFIYLLLAQCLVQLPNLHLKFCSYLAAVTHFAWLSVFTWMTALAVHIYFTFGNFAMTFKFGSSFIKYLVVCTLMPAVLVGICISLDHISDAMVRVRYGQGSCTWISDFNGLIYFFYVPVAISLTVNFFCFCSALLSMKRTSDVTGSESRVSRNMFPIYIKMSSLMGFTWLFGFIASVANINALWYVYIILNGLQGCFIFVSFHFNSRTGRLVLLRIKTFSSRRSKDITCT